MTIAVTPIPGLPMIRPGDDLPRLLGDAIEAARVGLKAGDVVAVCQKVVSKAEGAVVRLDDVVASPVGDQVRGVAAVGVEREVAARASERGRALGPHAERAVHEPQLGQAFVRARDDVGDVE